MDLRSANLAIRPIEIQRMVQSGREFIIHDIPKTSKETINPVAKEIVGLLKKQYPELAKQNKSRQGFLDALLNKFRSERPSGITHEQFAGNVIDEISQNPEIESKISQLADNIYA